MSWDLFHAQGFGYKKWDKLLEAMEKKQYDRKGYLCFLINRFLEIHTDDNTERKFNQLLTNEEIWPTGIKYLWRTKGINSLSSAYWLDNASCMAVMMMDIQRDQKVLDMCAAPGGKSLLIAARLLGQVRDGLYGNAKLVCRDLSVDRIARLKDNFRLRIPADWIGKAISFERATRKPEYYDRILIDAPCSTDFHVCNSKELRMKWTPKSVKTNAKRQLKLLEQATNMTRLRADAEITYCTCALAEDENDGVIEKFLRQEKYFTKYTPLSAETLVERCNNAVEDRISTSIAVQLYEDETIDRYSYPDHVILVDRTKYGVQFLPDQTSLSGPLYVCVLYKKASAE